jgi:osmoprotectant transport system substrate-binding protein
MKPRTVFRAAFRAAGMGLAVALAACTSSTGNAPPAAGSPGGRHGIVISVGSFNFPESVLLAEIYGRAMAARGYPVRIMPNLGPRELVDPALMTGLLQLVPEYAGSALEFVSLGRLSATADAAAANRTLAKSLAGRGLLAARPAAAQNNNAIVVTAATAARYGSLNAQVVLDGRRARSVAEAWLCAQGLMRTGGVAQ